MSNHSLIVPAELQPSLDAVVAAARKGVKKPTGPAFDLITSWCAANPDESGVESGDYGEGFLVVSLDGELPGCSDWDVELPERADEIELTDEDRVAYIRERLDEIFDGASGDEDVYPMGCFIRVQASTGKKAIIGYFLSGGGGMGGLSVDWEGAYRNVKEFRADLRRGGCLTGRDDAEKTSDAALLRLWQGRASSAPEQTEES